MVAVDVLATSPASLQKRLEGAYRSFIDIEPEDFDDDEMQATFEQIRSRLTRNPTGTDRCHRCDLQANVRSGGRRNSRFYLQPLSEDCGETSLLLLTTIKSPHADHEANKALGPSRRRSNVCLWLLADMQAALMNVRFEGNNGHDADERRCPLMTKSDTRPTVPALGPSSSFPATRFRDAVPWLSRGKSVMMPLRQKFLGRTR